MKKILAALLALAMLACMSVTVFATEATLDALGEQDIDLEAVFNDRGDDVYNDVYSVNVEWDDMTFTYSTQKLTYTWNEEDLDWEVTNTLAAGWDKANATITVTNRSSLGINVAAEATDDFVVTGAGNVESAIVADGDNAAQTLTLTVTPPSAITADIADASVTVTIGAYVPMPS